ncbi:MAG: zinc ribbon domain-containing protein [Thaumarchaeota archaeon]|nr:zinc ribbon domain-containing protein [Candidatus Geocrenenecus arthurdayi]
MRLKTLAAGILAYFTSLLLPAFIYTYLIFQQISDIILDITVIAAVGIVVGLESALITKNKLKAVLTSVIGGVLGLLTPYIFDSILQISLPPLLLIVLGRPLFHLTILSSPALAAIISLAYLSMVKPKPQPIIELKERREEMIEERKEELVVEEKQFVEEPVKEGAPVEAIREEAEAEVKPMEIPTVTPEPELDIIKELVKEIEEETKTKEEAVLEEAPVTREVTVEELLKKCKHCGEMIPYDSIYCPLCGEYQGEE